MAEGYKNGDIFKNQLSYNTYEIIGLHDGYIEVNIKDHKGEILAENHMMKKDYLESEIENGVFSKIENVPCGTIDNESIYGNQLLYVPLDGSTIQMKEMVNHPKHYNAGKYEVIDVIDDWGLNFSLGNAIKYIARCEHKANKLEDLKKALWYIQHEIDKLQKGDN